MCVAGPIFLYLRVHGEILGALYECPPLYVMLSVIG